MLSSGQHTGLDDIEITPLSVKSSSGTNLGRLVSVRDLLKWCNRVAMHIKDKDCDLANLAFQVSLKFFFFQ